MMKNHTHPPEAMLETMSGTGTSLVFVHSEKSPGISRQDGGTDKVSIYHIQGIFSCFKVCILPSC